MFNSGKKKFLSKFLFHFKVAFLLLVKFLNMVGQSLHPAIAVREAAKQLLEKMRLPIAAESSDLELLIRFRKLERNGMESVTLPR